MANASNQDWQYLNNQIANALTNSYGETNIFATDHLSKLKSNIGDPDILSLYNRTDAAYENFYNDYSNWKQSTAFWKGATSKVNSLLDDLMKNKLPKWEILVQVEYDTSSEEYITLFPQGRSAFRDVGKDGKILLLKTLVNTLNTYSTLQDVHTAATDAFTLISVQRDRQQQREKAVKDAAEQLRTTQAILFDIMYRNLGALMDKYGSNSTDVLNFFDVSMIRTTSKKDPEQDTNDIEPVTEDDTVI